MRRLCLPSLRFFKYNNYFRVKITYQAAYTEVGIVAAPPVA